MCAVHNLHALSVQSFFGTSWSGGYPCASDLESWPELTRPRTIPSIGQVKAKDLAIKVKTNDKAKDLA